MDHLRLFIVAINDGGNAAFAAQSTGGSLASPVARLGRQRKHIAHVHVSNSGLSMISATPPGMTMNGSRRA
jgi:hypothetical protein